VESPQNFLERAIPTLQRSDPIPKLLPQVRLGRMPKDSPALQAITFSWLDTFLSLLNEGAGVLDVNGVVRLDPNPRMAVLIEAGVLRDDEPIAKAIRDAYTSALDAARQRVQSSA
jgi:hypothetical protein